MSESYSSPSQPADRSPAAASPAEGEGSAELQNRPASGPRGRMGQVAGVQVAATGSFVPERVVSNEDLAALGCDSEWIIRRTGIQQRRYAESVEATSDLACEAARRCLRSARVDISEIDLILVATITPDHPTPSTACHVQRRLGAWAPAMDINAACAGFMYAMVTGAQFVATGNSRRVLVIGADLMSRTIDPDDKKTYPLFGDAAGAALLCPDDAKGAGLLSYQLGSEGCGGQMLCIPAGGTRMPLTPAAHAERQQYLRMDGRSVFKWAVRVIAESSRDCLKAAAVSADEVALVVLHQANQRIIDSAVNDLKVDPDRVFVNLDRFGNTSGASVPLALDEAVAAGRIRRGDYVLLSGFGAGLAWGTALLRW